MDRVDVRELAYFVAVAHARHFGRAADALGISQPPLSRAIRRLEDRLGVVLFERTSRSVALTAAGEALLERAPAILAAVDDAVTATRRAAHGRGPLRIAVKPGTGTGLTRELVVAYREEGDGERVVETVTARDPAAAVRDGAADVAVLCSRLDLTGLSAVPLASEMPSAIVALDHPLAGRATVTLAELRAEPEFVPLCSQDTLEELIDRVALGRVTTMVGPGGVARAGDAVAALPVVDAPPTELLLAWREGSDDAATLAFVGCALALPAVA